MVNGRTTEAPLVAAIPLPRGRADAAPLLSAKLDPPDLTHATVLRPRLIGELSNAVRRHPLTVLSGPAGSGKTVLAASWRDADPGTRSIAWLTLDDNDDDPGTFWSYVAAALDSIGVPVGQLPGLVPGEAPPSRFVPMLAAAVAALPQPVVLIVDNADHVTSKAVTTGLDLLLRNSGTRLRVVLCARADPQLPLHQYRLAGTMAELRGDQLAFTGQETRELLAAMGVSVTLEVAGRLCAETQGWAVGLRLAAAPIKQGASPERLATSLAQDDGSVAQYMFAEVLAAQPASVRRFLLRISVSAELHPDLVDRLAGRPGSRRMLTALARANAFVEVSARAPGGFQIHPLFREMLLAQLGYDRPHDVAGLHRACAAWYAEAARAPEATAHAIAAGDWEFAARLLVDDLVVPRVLTQAAEHVRRSLRALPPQLGGSEAAVLRAALALTNGSRPAPADLAVAAAVPDGERAALRASAALICLAAAATAGAEPAEVLSRADRAEAALLDVREDDRPEHREFIALISNARAVAALRGDGDPSEIIGHLRVAAGTARAAGSQRLRGQAIALLAVMESMEGRLTRAIQYATEAEELSVDAGRDKQDRAVATAAAMAWVELQRSALGEAREWLAQALVRERHAPQGPEEAVIGAVVGVVHAQSLRLRREYELAEEAVQLLLSRTDLPRWVRERAVVEAGRIAFSRGHLASGVELLEDESVEDGRRTRLRALAALLGADGLPAPLPTGEPAGAPADVVEHRVLRACQLAAAGTSAAAVDELERALAAARPELNRLPFVDAPPQARRLLRMYPRLQGPARWLSPSSTAAPEPGPGAPVATRSTVGALTQDLSQRETEVLQHLAEMLSTAEIAATMFISVNTVRTHIRSILRKLGVSRRNQAVRRAREAGLI